MPRITVVAGARPNFMKIAPILHALAARRSRLEPEIVHTGQHYDPSLSDVFFEQLAIPAPDVHLDVGSATHGMQTARVLEAFEDHLLRSDPRPVGIVVVGDVNSTMAAALAAVKLGIPVAHVEAGLRSFDRGMPEEINRVVTDAVADLLLVSEPAGEENLRREGIAPERIRYVGNVMIDTVARQLSTARALPILEKMGLDRGKYVLVTLHRPSNVDFKDRLEALVGFLHRVAYNLQVVFPVHPRTVKRLREFGLYDRLANGAGMHVVSPLGYHETLGLMEQTAFVITDSGGIQEETTYLGVPCLTFRPNTERPVTVSEGTNTVVGDDLARAEELVGEILAGRYKKGKAVRGWDGCAAERVVDVLEDVWMEPGGQKGAVQP